MYFLEKAQIAISFKENRSNTNFLESKNEKENLKTITDQFNIWYNM